MMNASMNPAPLSPAAADDRVPRHLVRVAVVAGFGSLLLNLSTTTLNVALDKLIGDLHTTLDVAQWTLTGYLLALTLVLPLFRWSAERIGVRRLYLVSLVGFTLSSALCAAAWSIESLIAFRVLQGAVGGLLTPIAQALTAQHAGERHMGRLLSIVAVPVLAAPLLGPVVGGLLVGELSWRWIFLINVPLGAVCTVLCARELPADEPGLGRGPRLDLGGLALLSPGMALVIYGISNLRRGGGPTTLSSALVPFVIAAALLVLFVRHARRSPERALVDLRLLRERTVGAALATYVLSSLVSFGGQLLLPLYYQQVRGQTPLQAGLLLAPQGLGMILTMPRIGALSDQHDPASWRSAACCSRCSGRSSSPAPRRTPRWCSSRCAWSCGARASGRPTTPCWPRSTGACRRARWPTRRRRSTSSSGWAPRSARRSWRSCSSGGSRSRRRGCRPSARPSP
jgi:EmrB/QacA subfamily drug resistance transporter